MTAVRGWTLEEVAKSHPLAPDTKDKNPIEYFFDIGATVVQPAGVKPWKNPFHDECRTFYLDFWNAHKQNTKVFCMLAIQ